MIRIGRKIKAFIKKHEFILAVELAVIGLVVSVSILTTSLVYIQEQDVAYDTYEKVSYLFNDMSVDDCNGSVGEVLYQIANNVALGYGNVEYNSYGIVWELYDSEGNVLEKSEKDFVLVEYMNPDNDGKSEYYYLEKYFTKEEIKGFLDYTYESEKSIKKKQHSVIEKMVGYYEGEEFIPVEVVFADSSDYTKKFRLIHKEKYNKDDIEYFTKYSADEGEELGAYTYYRYYVSKNMDKAYKNAHSLLEKYRGDKEQIKEIISNGDYMPVEEENGGGAYVQAPVEFLGGDVACVVMAVSVDVMHKTLHSSIWRNSVIGVILVLHCGGCGIIASYISSEKKRKKLEVMRNTFINAMAHEMKTPAAVIINSVECIEDGIHPEKQKQYLEKVRREAVHMSNILSDMLAYTRVTDAEYKLKKEKISIEEMLRTVCEHYGTVMEQKDIKLQWDVKALCVIDGDYKLMEMVLDNYVSNAVKYCKNAGIIKIIIESDKLKVYNEGVAINPREIDQIWEPLFVADESRKQTGTSSGMGLAISAGILKLHNMKYGVKNRRDGVEFYIDFRNNQTNT